MRRSHAAHFSSLKCLFQRKGSIVVLAAFLMVLMVACIAFAVDLGCLYVARGQAQGCADAAALAAGWTMAGDDRIRQDSGNAFAAASRKAIETAALEDINHSIRPVAGVPSMSVVSEVLFGRLNNPDNHGEALSFPPPRQCNTVLVRVACTPERNTPVPLFFARIFGLRTAGVKAEAAAIFEDHNTVGFRVTENTPNCSVMPFVVNLKDWQTFLASGTADHWSYSPDTKAVSSGSDGIAELKVFPASQSQGKGKGGGITPGNFGTVDIGNNNNAAPDLWRQIRKGPSADDLAHYGGTLQLDPVTGTLDLNGDTGMTASMKSALDDIIGLPRTILLYSDVRAQGNGTWFTICGFAGVRVVNFDMTSQNKYILVQPTVVVDGTAISGASGSSYFVGPPVHLVR
ncbi:MAG: pilus assembly protein TadG-related protein [Planctomycetia bacterium]|nr:pilus assembly protein TadG-related protein [Planctomycetia bacterium]